MGEMRGHKSVAGELCNSALPAPILLSLRSLQFLLMVVMAESGMFASVDGCVGAKTVT